MYEQIAKITQSWHRVKFYFMCISSPWYLIMVLHEENPFSHYGEMQENGQKDGWMGWTYGSGTFLYSLIPLLWSGA